MDGVNRIAVIHMGGIGDLVQAMPALGALRREWPGAIVTLVGRPERAALAQMAGLADACADYDTGAKSVALAGADLVVDFVSSPDAPRGMPGALLPRACSDQRTSMPAQRQRRHAARWLAAAPLPPPDWAKPAAEWILGELSARLDLAPVPAVPELPVPEAVIAAAREALAAGGIGGRFAAIHPGSGSPKKNWPADRFAEIARRLRRRGPAAAWLAGPAELERGTLPADLAGGAVVREPALERLAGILACADIYIGNDSGATHLAAAVRRPGGGRTPTIALFGPSDARVWGPRGPNVRIIRSADGTMDGIGVDRVWAEAASSMTGRR
jgi:ADP-heptose:LPS heptosyltransferase